MLFRSRLEITFEDQGIENDHNFLKPFTKDELNEILLEAVQNDPDSFDVIPLRHMSFDMLKAAIDNDVQLSSVVRYLDREFAVDKRYFDGKYTDPQMLNEIVKYAFDKDPDVFEDIPPNAQTPEMILYAIDQNWKNIKHCHHAGCKRKHGSKEDSVRGIER